MKTDVKRSVGPRFAHRAPVQKVSPVAGRETGQAMAEAKAGASTRVYDVCFVLEQVLGHVSLAQNIKRFVPEDPSVRPVWADVTFYKEAGLVERVPGLPAYVRGALRAYLEVRSVVGKRRLDGLVFNTQKPAIFCGGYLRRVPSAILTDVTPMQYDAMADIYGHRPDGPGPIKALKYRANRRIFHLAQVVLPWSNWVRESLIKDYSVGAEKIEVVPPGVDLDLWAPPSQKRAGGPVRLLFVGGDFARKGGRLLLNVFSAAKWARRCELHIVTRDPVEEGRGVIVHRGLANNSPELRGLYHAADIFVLPTLADCFSVASVEAMACGLPVVATRVGGIPDIVQPRESGFLVEPGNQEELSDALAQLVASAPLRRAMGRKGREIAAERFDARKNTRRLLELVKRRIEA